VDESLRRLRTDRIDVLFSRRRAVVKHLAPLLN